VQTQRHQKADDQRDAQQEPAGAADFGFAALDKGLNQTVGFGDGQHADQALAIADGRCHMHDGPVAVLRGIFHRGARAVFAAQSARHIVPAREIRAQRLAAGIEHHDAARVGHINLQARFGFADAPVIRARRALPVGRDLAREMAVGHLAGAQIVAGEPGQQVGGIDQRVFLRLAHAGFDLFDKHIEHKPGRDADDQKITEQKAQAQAHGDLDRL